MPSPGLITRRLLLAASLAGGAAVALPRPGDAFHPMLPDVRRDVAELVLPRTPAP